MRRRCSVKERKERTFQLGLERFQIGLVNGDQAVFPLACARDHLAHFFFLFLLCERTDAITRNDILENSQLGKYGQPANHDVAGYWFGMGWCGHCGQGERVQTAEETKL